MLAGYAGCWLYGLANAQAVDVTAVLTIAAPVTVIIKVILDGASVPDPVGLAVVAGGAVLVAVAASARTSEPVDWST